MIIIPSTTQDNTKFVDILWERINSVGKIIVYTVESHFRGYVADKELPQGFTLVTPRPNQTTASDGSTIKIKFHQDMSMFEKPPRYTFLMGIQEHPTEKVYTYILSNQKLYDLLSKKCRCGLQQAIFMQNKPTSYSNNTDFEPFLRALLVMVNGRPMFKIRATDTNEIEPVGDLARACYKELKEKRDFAADPKNHLVEIIFIEKGGILKNRQS